MGFNWKFKGLKCPLTLTLKRGEYGELIIMPANGRWDLTGSLKG